MTIYGIFVDGIMQCTAYGKTQRDTKLAVWRVSNPESTVEAKKL